MTCIVGLEHEGQVVLGHDGFGAASWTTAGARRDAKGWRHDGGEGQPSFVFGATSSYRMLQVLRFHAAPPELPAKHVAWDDDAWLEWMVVTYVEHVRTKLKDLGVVTTTNGEDACGNWLVGIGGGRLFNVGSDFQVGRSAHAYDACGSGEATALGAMHALASDRGGGSRPADIPRALTAAFDHGAGVRQPFTLLTTE